MMISPKELTLLIAEDDDDDFLILEKSLAKAEINNFDVVRVFDGEDLMRNVLSYQEKRAEENKPSSLVILLDLNMPKKDGREVLKEIKSNPTLRHIPIVVLTTSKSEKDVQNAYDMGVNAYAIKPSDLNGFQDLVQILLRHWVKTVELPTV